MDKKSYLNLMLTVTVILLISFVTTMINQVAQLVNMASKLHPYFGIFVLVIFASLGLAAMISITLILFKLDKPLVMPDESNKEEYEKYITEFKKRLMKNKYLKKIRYEWDDSKSNLESVNDALKEIDMESQRLIKFSATGVFTTTAVSQNGSLDGIFVFMASLKLVWKIASLYNQRPVLSDVVRLYTNVFGTVLAARQIDDLDIVAEQLGQILPAVVTGALGSAVPGVSFITSLVADSILEGTLNTLLVLRVGVLTQYYCRSITKTEPKRLAKTATVQACKILGEIISHDLKSIIGVWSKAVLKSIIKAPRGTKEYLMGKFSSRTKTTEDEVAVTDNDQY
ncbi:MAG: DUF697 domain-containing protein [Sedimentibacter sp.]|uniref:DUF697 domain-containing protein n=1 Tax=Sedimentibacter sp. TaxID=1960295 RepID=UPI00315850B4